jgi:dTDP-4-dehydrorhamnose 3,5-epimerase-like enzyme
MNKGHAEADLEHLLTQLKDTRGFDFTAYKRTTLARRIDKRMSEVGVESYAAYLDHLEVPPRRVRAPVRLDPHQRHVVLSRSGSVRALALHHRPESD